MAIAPPPPADAALLSVRQVTLQYKTDQAIVTATYRVDFEVQRSDRFILLGPSGCGKSTLLKAVGGYMAPIEGEIRLKGRAVTRPGPDRMMVFQEFDQLLPWKTVRAERRLRADRQPPPGAGARRATRAAHYIEKVGLDQVRRRLPAHAVGRHEAARRHRPRHGDGARHPADGRALRRARRADPPPHAGRAAAAVGGHALHRAVRHPLDPGGDQDRQPHPADVAASGPGEGRAEQHRPRGRARPQGALEARIHDMLFAHRDEHAAMSDTTLDLRPEILRDTPKTDDPASVEKAISPVERLYNQGLAAQGADPAGRWPLLWEGYARWLDNPLLVPTFTETFDALLRRHRQRRAAGPRAGVAADRCSSATPPASRWPRC